MTALLNSLSEFWKLDFINIIYTVIEIRLDGRQVYLDYKTIKGTVMQIEKVLKNDSLRLSKVYCKFRIPAIYDFVVIYP